MPSNVTYEGPKERGSSVTVLLVRGQRFRKGFATVVDDPELEAELAELENHKFKIEPVKGSGDKSESDTPGEAEKTTSRKPKPKKG